jgi:hypothetical protein
VTVGEKRISATACAHAARSGWRKPAVVRERTRFTSRKRTSAARAVHTIKSGWRKPAVRRGRAQLRKNACICNCDTEPRRANARRSCECAFVQRRWGVVQRTNVSWTRSGWRKPAVGRGRGQLTKTLASASAIPNHGGLTPAALGRMCGRRRTVRDVYRTTFALHTTAGRRLSLLRMCVCAVQMGRCAANERVVDQERLA